MKQILGEWGEAEHEARLEYDSEREEKTCKIKVKCLCNEKKRNFEIIGDEVYRI